ncbi:MAG TPA: ABC transporter ATP-binding protein [Acholeplasmataceae bacterium]|nr:ABC transporter ATP-binding protein [Acholeplasmataceae bacterium]
MLKIKNLTKRYYGSNVDAVKNVSLELHKGEIFGLLGLNGSGKTTTFKAITGIHPFDEGEIIINGYNLKDNPIEAKMELAYIPDNHATFEELTGIEYINFMADMYKVSVRDRIERVAKLEKLLAMSEHLNKQIKTYSHGMKQKIAIMGGIIHYPNIWILDEPLVGLDPISMEEIKSFILDYAKGGKTVIFSSHILSIVEELCDRVAIIDHGEIKGTYQVDDSINLNKIFQDLVKR